MQERVFPEKGSDEMLRIKRDILKMREDGGGEGGEMDSSFLRRSSLMGLKRRKSNSE